MIMVIMMMIDADDTKNNNNNKLWSTDQLLQLCIVSDLS
jgi:hypothetical protein